MTEVLEWDDVHRKAAWLVMARMRVALKIQTNPTVGRAYVILQKYFHNNHKSKENRLYIFLITAYMIEFKNEDIKVDSRPVFNIFLSTCDEFQKVYKPNQLPKIFGIESIESRLITVDEEKAINRCEMDILQSLNYNLKIDLPFAYFQEGFLQFANSMDQGDVKKVEKAFDKYVTAFFSAPEYLSIDPRKIAASFLTQFNTHFSFPKEAKDWGNNNIKKEECEKIIKIFSKQVDFLSIKTQEEE